jgi:hypothetical protein
MKPIDAYYFAMTKINELRKDGIEVAIKPTKSRNNKDVVRKYNRSDRIPPELWNHISFKISDTVQAQKIMKMANYLGMCGITYDTGGCAECRDWEFDWSFSYKEGEENWEWRNRREEVEDMINQMCKEK